MHQTDTFENHALNSTYIIQPNKSQYSQEPYRIQRFHTNNFFYGWDSLSTTSMYPATQYVRIPHNEYGFVRDNE